MVVILVLVKMVVIVMVLCVLHIDASPCADHVLSVISLSINIPFSYFFNPAMIENIDNHIHKKVPHSKRVSQVIT